MICIQDIMGWFRSLLGSRSTSIIGSKNTTQIGDYNTINNYVLQDCPIKPMQDFVRTFKNTNPYIAPHQFDEWKNALLNPQVPIVRLVGLSGLGKTRLIYEIYKDNALDNFYCQHSSELQLSQLANFIKDHENKKSVIVLDDCCKDLFDHILHDMANINTQLRIIAIYHNPEEEKRRDDVNTLVLGRHDMRDAVDAYIDKEMTSLNGQDGYITKKIKAIADGFPNIAYRAVDVYKQSGSTAMIKDIDLWERLLGDDIHNDELKCMQTLSLFDPLGYVGDVKSDYDRIINWDDLNALYGKLPQESQALFYNALQNFFSRELVEQNGSWLTVRPLPFAVWLVSEWFNSCDSDRFGKVLVEMCKPENKRLALAFYNRIKYMSGNVKAQEAIDRLLASDNLFFCEEVIFSGFGSQLLRAMSYVNHTAVCRVLYEKFWEKDIEWLKTNIADNVRSNIVWCLESLCEAKDTFQKGVLMMAKLSLAENAIWANNATGHLRELFHIVLSGTTVNLDERYKALLAMYDEGETFTPAVITALTGAFDYGFFVRTRAVSQADDTTINDYVPDKREICDYWTRCVQLVEKMISERPSCDSDLSRELAPHIISLGRDAGYWKLSYRLFEAIGPYIGDERKNLRKQLIDVRSSLPQSDTGFYDKWIESLSSCTFDEEMEDKQQKFFNFPNWEWDNDGMERQIEFFRPLAESFVDRKYYNDSETVDKLIDNKTYQIAFLVALQRALGNKIKDLFHAVIDCLRSRECTYCSNVVVNICNFASQDKDIKLTCLVDDFLVQLRKGNYNVFYTAVAAHKEDENLNVLTKILTIIEESKWDKQSTLETYLLRVPTSTPEQMLHICQKINCPALALNFILKQSFNRHLLAPPMLGYVEQILIDCLANSTKAHEQREMEMLAVRILETNSSPDFARRYAEKVIDEMGQEYANRFDGIFTALLPKYEDVVLDIILSRLSDKEYQCFSLCLAVGSGTGFGTGPLFLCDNEKIKDYCLKEADGILPARLASMAPIFNDDASSPAFGKFIMWMFDNFDKFNKQEAVLEAILLNLGTFSWIGSIVPLYDKEKRCFMSIRNSSNALVRKWSAENIKWLEAKIQNAKDEEYAISRIS